MSEAIYEEEQMFWTLISTEGFNINYSDVKAMTDLEMKLAYLALQAVLKRKNKKNKR